MSHLAPQKSGHFRLSTFRPMPAHAATKRGVELRRLLVQHAHRDYVVDRPQLRNAEHDRLFQVLQTLEAAL